MNWEEKLIYWGHSLFFFTYGRFEEKSLGCAYKNDYVFKRISDLQIRHSFGTCHNIKLWVNVKIFEIGKMVCKRQDWDVVPDIILRILTIDKH